MLGISQTACYGEGSSLSIKMHKTELPRKRAFRKEKTTLHLVQFMKGKQHISLEQKQTGIETGTSCP